MSLSKILAAAGLALLITELSAFPADYALSGKESVLVLRNGFVLRGIVTPIGDQYLVMQKNSDKLHIPASRVELVCRNLEEAYFSKRGQIAPGDVRAHMALASWCLRHQLRSRGADQVLAAIALDPGHPGIPALKNRLRMAARPTPVAATSLETDTPAAQDNPQTLPITGLSASSIQQFTASVQPLLMNSCAAGACHGPGSQSSFRLERPPLGQHVNSRLTQRNLRSVLQFVEPHAPLESLLLVTPQRPHGGLLEPVLSASPQTDTLRAWLLQLSGKRRLRPRSAQFRDPAALLQRVRSAHVAHNADPRATDAEDAEPIDSGSENGGTTPPPESSRDPFDPAAFNRKR